jgi:hypothetical protein
MTVCEANEGRLRLEDRLNVTGRSAGGPFGVPAVALLLLLGSACNDVSKALLPQHEEEKFELKQDKRGRIIRLNKVTGEVAIVDGTQLVPVRPPDIPPKGVAAKRIPTTPTATAPVTPISAPVAQLQTATPNVAVEIVPISAPVPAGRLSGIELELGSKRAHVINNSTDQKVFDELLRQLQEWKRWEVVDAKGEANVLLVFSDRVTNYGPVGVFAGGTGTIVPVISDQRFLILVDPATNENILTISCERRLRASYTAGVLVNRLRDRIVKDERNRKPR